MEKDELKFCSEWLTLENYSFKILAIITVLADNKLAFRGTLADLCKSLGVGNSSPNKNRIKRELDFLQQNNFAQIIIDKDIYTISLAAAAEKSKNIIKIKKAWYTLIRDTHSSTKPETSWESMLKVFLILLELPPDNTYTYTSIGERAGLKKSAIGRCVKALEKIDFKDFRFSVTTDKVRTETGKYYNLGRTYCQMIEFK